jgi:excisionase family DNA binding protein
MHEDRKQLLLSPNNAARVLDVSRATIYALMKIGRIRYVYVGADRRIPATELERVAKEGTATTAAA